MEKIITHEDYIKANLRLEEILNLVDDNTPEIDPMAIELTEVSGLHPGVKSKWTN